MIKITVNKMILKPTHCQQCTSANAKKQNIEEKHFEAFLDGHSQV